MVSINFWDNGQEAREKINAILDIAERSIPSIWEDNHWYLGDTDTWINATWPQGNKWDKGDTGPQGSKGDKGDKGDKWDTGSKGDKGDTGPQGATWPQGEQGIQWEQGIQGETWPQGEQGATGNGISSITSSKSGTTNTITVHYTNWESDDFEVEDWETPTAWQGIDITSNIISTTFNYWVSDTAAATVEKTVTIPGIKELNVWQVVIVKPTVTSTVANSTLKVNNFPAYDMLYNWSAITTSTDSIVRGANIPSMFMLDEVSGTKYRRFLAHWLDSNTTYSINYSFDAWKKKAGVGKYAISRYTLAMEKPNGTWESLKETSTNYSTATTKTVNTSWFLLGHIRYYGTTTVVANGALIASNTLYNKAASVDLRYSTNCWGTTTWAEWDYIYLVGTIWADGLFYLDTTQRRSNSLPNTNDWKVYIRIGVALAAWGYTASLLDDRPIFYHNGTEIKEYNSFLTEKILNRPTSWNYVLKCIDGDIDRVAE